MRYATWLCLALGVAACWLSTAGAAEPARELLAAPKPETALVKVLDWYGRRGVTDPDHLNELNRLWAVSETAPSAEELLDRVVQSFCLADADTRIFVAQLVLPAPAVNAPDPGKLLTGEQGPFYAANLRLYYGRYLMHREMYDEALDVLSGADVRETVDPATYLFCKASCEKSLLMKTEGIADIDRLLKDVEAVPVRYTAVATLMRADLEDIKDKSLDEISWKMDDVERRLGLGRAGEKVQKVESEIIAALDEIIKKLEEQQGGGGGGGGGQGNGAQNNSNQSGSPAQDSQVKGATAPGQVDKKHFKDSGNWGNLDDKERAKVKNLISRDFPAHYRQAVEEYFKKLANRESRPK